MFSRTCIRFSSLVLVLVVALTALPGLPGGAVAAAASSEDFRAPAEFSVLAAASHLLALVDHMAGEAMTWAEPTTPSPLRLQVDADTVPATPGDIVTVTVSAQYRGVEATDLQVSGVLPRGLDFVAGGDGVVWSPRLAAIFWEVEELAPGQTATAQFQAQVTAVGPGVHLDLNLEADGNRLPDLVAGTVRIPVLPSRATQVTVRPSQAGNLEVDGGRLRVHVPAGTSAAGLTLRHAWRRPAAQQLYAFDLNVTPPVRFQRPVAVALRLAQGDGRVLASGSLTLRRFDPQSGEWQPVETSLDAETDTLTAELYEGGLLAVTEENESSYLKGMLTPSVLGLQASLWTGDSSYSYPLALPPAPGGQSPALALTYSSGAANSMLEADLHDRSAQASDLGLGWQIAGAGYITRSGDGRHFLNMDGASYELVSCTDPQCSPDEWKTEPESFLQVLHDKDYKVQVGTDSIYGNCTNHQQGYVDIKARDTVPWTVRTKDGTTYTFGSDVDANGLPVDSGATPYHWVYGGERSEVPGDCSGSAGDLLGKVKMRPYRWNLVTVQPPAGPAWHYQYGSKRMKLRYNPDKVLCEVISNDASDESRKGHIRHTWLESIEYGWNDPQGRLPYRVEFNYTGKDVDSGYPDHRRDIPTGFNWRRADPDEPDGYDCRSQWLVSDMVADSIVVQARADTNQAWSDSHVVRVYDLDPQKGGYTHLALTSIAERDGRTGQPGSVQLPPTVLTYATRIGGAGNGEALQSVANGYGGQVTLEYDLRQCGDELECPPDSPHNGRIVVMERHVSSWPGLDQSVQEYTYTGGLYVDEGENDSHRWSFYGFEWVTDKLYPANESQMVRKNVVRFYQTDRQRKGKTLEEKVVAPDGSLLHRLQYWYSTSQGWPRLWKVREQADSTQQRLVRRFYHQTSRQGNAQYGNLTQTVEYDADDAIYRNSVTWYYPNDGTDVYIVNRPGLAIDYEGNSSTFSAIRRQHNMQYDGHASHQDPPTQGLLTYEKTGRPLDAWEQSYFTWDTASGNLVSTRRLHGDGEEVEQRTEYDGTFDAFPVRVTRAYGTPQALETEYVYYGVNDGAWPNPVAGRFGRVKQVVDRSNSGGGDTLVAEARSVDTFGRLCTVSRAHPNSANQVERAEVYRYNDVNTCENLGSQEPALPPFDPTALNPIRPFAVVQQLQDGGGDMLGSGGGLKTYTFYDGLGQAWQTQQETDTEDQWLATHTGYDAQGLVAARYYPFPVTSTGNRGSFVWPLPGQYDQALTYTYDGLGRVLKETQYDGSQSVYVYQDPLFILYPNSSEGAWYWPEQVTDPVGRQRIAYQDSWGRLARVVEIDGSNQYLTTYAYDVQDNLVQLADAAGNVTQIEYDSLGRKLHMHDPDMSDNGLGARNPGCETLVENDGWGDDAWEAGGSSPPSWTCKGGAKHWGQRGLEVATGGGDGWLRVKTYGTWQAGQTYTLSVWVRRASGSGGVVQLRGWSNLGGEQGVAASETLSTSWQKVEGSYTVPAGASDVRIMLRFPENATVFVDDVNADYWWSYRYDPAGNLVQQVDARGQQVDFSYDPLNRLTVRSPADGPAASFEYDSCLHGAGRLCYSFVGSGSYDRSYVYDRRGGVAGESVTIDGDSYTTGYTHDRLDRPLTIAYPDGEVVSYEYDGGGQLRRLGTNQGADYVSDTLFDGRGRLQRRVYGGVDLEDWYSYHDGSGNFLLQRHLTRRSSQPGTTYLNQEYLYNAAGDVVRWQDHGFPGSWQRRFAYDDLGRLCGASYDNQDTTQGCGHPDYEYEYRHDATGNLTFKRGMSLSYPAAGSPHPHAAQSDGSYGYEYDANGNLLVTWQGDSPVATYAWDGKNRLQSVWAGGKTVQYGYDADGRLAERVLDGLSTHYPGPHYVVEKSAGAGGGDIVTRYYLVDGQRQVLRRTGDADPGRNGRFTIHGDHLGSTSLVMNQQLQKADELRYYPFGETYAGDPGTATTDHAYTGQRWEASIGLYYYGARWYNPALGRFISPDTIVPEAGDPQSLNRYSYVNNNPLRYTDPTGNYLFEDEPADSFFVSPGNSPTGEPMVIAEPCNVGDCHTADAGDLVMVATLPIWAGVGGVAAEAAIFDLGVPAVRAGWGRLLQRLGIGACADGDCGNEVQITRRVFWSGGKAAQQAATAWAKANNATTLEMTEVGQRVQETTKGLNWLTQARPQWAAASQEFATGATGEVHVFQAAKGVDLQSIWATVEYQALMLNQNVTRIIFHVVMPDGSDVRVP